RLSRSARAASSRPARSARGRGANSSICQVPSVAPQHIMPLLAGTPNLIMIRMLVADDGRHLLRPLILHRGLARQVWGPNHPAEPGFGAILPRRRHAIGPVERAGHDLDLRSVDAAKTQRRAARRAKAALRDRGGAEEGRLALGPDQIAPLDGGK